MNTAHKKLSKHTPSIFQGRLNLSAAAKPHVALAVEYPVERIIMRALIAFLILLAFCYLYFVSASVINVMARKEALAEAAKIEGTIGGLEGKYFTLSQAITSQSADALGLSPIQTTGYVTRPGNVGIADTVGEKQI